MGSSLCVSSNERQEIPSTELTAALKRSISAKDVRNEDYTLIWLDHSANENRIDSLRTRTLLKQVNNDNCEFFDNADKFLSRMEAMNYQKLKTLVIMSGRFSKDILLTTKPSDDTADQFGKTSTNRDLLPSVIIFCSDYNKYRELVAVKCHNVIDVCTDHETLKQCILRELPSLRFNLFPNQKLMSTRALSPAQDTVEYNAYFSYSLFVDLLREQHQQGKTKSRDKDIMLNKCRDFYRRNQYEMEKIEEFRRTYTPEKAIYWYTRDSFVYRLINRAFRTEDMALWYLFRFFVIDLCSQMHKMQKQQQQHLKEPLILYRGQSQMPVEELTKIKQNIGGLISTNGFLSTSKSEEIALQFVLGAENTDNLKVILYEIELHPSHAQSVVFVDLENFSSDSGEQEVLFIIGCLQNPMCYFRL
jgi:hypothetical protein